MVDMAGFAFHLAEKLSCSSRFWWTLANYIQAHAAG
jgi:hypothetical protein